MEGMEEDCEYFKISKDLITETKNIFKEKVGKNVFKAAEKAVPVVAGVVGIVKG